MSDTVRSWIYQAGVALILAAMLLAWILVVAIVWNWFMPLGLVLALASVGALVAAAAQALGGDA